MSVKNCVEKDSNRKQYFINQALAHFRELDHPFTTYLNNHLNQIFSDEELLSWKRSANSVETCPFCGFSFSPENKITLKRRKDVYELVKQKKRGWRLNLELLKNTPKKSKYASSVCKNCKNGVLFEFKKISTYHVKKNKNKPKINGCNNKLGTGAIKKCNEINPPNKTQISTHVKVLSALGSVQPKGKSKKGSKPPLHDKHDEEKSDAPDEAITTTPLPTTTATPSHTKLKKESRLTRQIHALKSILQSIRSWNTTSYEEMSWWLQFLNRSCEPYSHLYSIGSSVQNRELWVVALSDNPEKHEVGEPEVKIVGNIHGNENVGREVILHMIDYICSNIDSDSDLRTLVESTRIHFLPSMNPDGYEMFRVHKDRGKNVGRLNANGVDLNRNFPDQFFPSFHDPEPETLAVMKWLEDIPFMLSAALHDGAFVVSYPFDDSPSGQTKYSATPDDDIFRYLARLYAETHPEMHLSNMGNCSRYSQHKKFIGGITNGAEWSSLSNTMQDFNYVQTNCYEITVEMSCLAALNSSIIANIFQQNYPSLIAFIRQALRGIKGIVTDTNNKPLKDVHISISDRKHDIKTASDGDYWRLVLPGSYEVTARLRGYETQTRVVTVENSLALWVNFTLIKTTPDPSVSALGHVNPFQRSLNLMIFETDGRDSSDAEGPEEETDSKREPSSVNDADEIRGFDYSIETKPIKIPVKDISVNIKTTYTVPTNQMANKKEEVIAAKTTKPNKDFSINDILSCQIPGRTQNLVGRLRWSGTIPELANHTTVQLEPIVLGLELSKPDDLATDGTFLGKRYFTTKPNRAYFIPKNLCKRSK